MVSSHHQHPIDCLADPCSAADFDLGMMSYVQMYRVRQKAHFLLGPGEFGLFGPIQRDHTLTDHLMRYHGHATKMLQSRQ